MCLSMAANSKHIYNYVCGNTLCARADAMRPRKLSAPPPGDQRRSEASGTDAIQYVQENIWVRTICMCWPYGRRCTFYCATKRLKRPSLAELSFPVPHLSGRAARQQSRAGQETEEGFSRRAEICYSAT